MPHEFLSDDWFVAVEAIQDEAPEPPPALKDVVINVVVTEAPDGEVQLHFGAGQFGRGHEDGAPTTLTLPYDVAKSLFVGRDQQAAMQAFMAGQIKVAGDMSKLLAMQSAAPTPEQQAFSDKLVALTA